MIVDDNDDAKSMLATLLEASGRNSRGAAWSAAPAQALSEALYVCSLDIGPPDMNGNQRAHRLRSHPQGPSAMLTAATGYGQEQVKRKARAIGFTTW
jgi:CheY-like chemotaxis protein